MPDAPVAGANAPTTTPPATPPKFGEKFGDDTTKLEDGFRNLAKNPKLGQKIDADKPLVGEGGEFATHDELYRTYTRLERVQGAISNKPVDQPADGTIKLGGTPAPTLDDEYSPAELARKAGLKAEDLETVVDADGDLSDQIAALRKVRPNMGKVEAKLAIRAIVAEHKLGKQDVAAKIVEAHAIVGGKEQFEILISTAADYVPADRLPVIEALINKSNTVATAVLELQYHFNAKNGSGVGEMAKGGQPASGNGGAKDSAEFNALVHRAFNEGDDVAYRRLQATNLPTWMKS